MFCPWPISMHKFFYTFAKYNLQMPNTNAMPDANAVPMADLNARIYS